MSLGQVNALTFTLTGALGGIAGALIGSAVGLLSPLLIVPLTVKGLIVTVIGGLGSIPGAIIAGLLVGAAENVFQFMRGVTERDIYVMLLLFVFLVFRPGGILGTDPART
jgi:branched-chain amino acid transport system permease protein